MTSVKVEFIGFQLDFMSDQSISDFEAYEYIGGYILDFFPREIEVSQESADKLLPSTELTVRISADFNTVSVEAKTKTPDEKIELFKCAITDIVSHKDLDEAVATLNTHRQALKKRNKSNENNAPKKVREQNNKVVELADSQRSIDHDRIAIILREKFDKELPGFISEGTSGFHEARDIVAVIRDTRNMQLQQVIS